MGTCKIEATIQWVLLAFELKLEFQLN